MEQVTSVEWERLWWEEYGRLRHAFPTASPVVVQKATTKLMVGKYGVKPHAEPVRVPGPPTRLKIVALIAGKDMGSILKVISRFGPLIAAFLVGLVGVIPGADSILQGIVTALGFLGIQPDAESAAMFGNLVASALLLYGSVIKFYKLIRAKFFPPTA